MVNDDQPESNEIYFAKNRGRTLTIPEIEEFNQRLIEQFCADFWKSGNSADVPFWIMNEIATAFISTLTEKTGLNNALPLPWSPADSILKKSEERGMEIYKDTVLALLRDDSMGIQATLIDIAKKT